MSRSPSDKNAKNIGVLTCDLGWSNGCFSDSPAEGRRSSFVVDVFDFLFLLPALNWIDFSFLMFKKATQCRLLKPLVFPRSKTHGV